MRNSITNAAVAAAVAALLIGGWFLFRLDRPTAASSPGSGPAPTTELAWPSYSYGPPSTSAPEPYPVIPSEQVREESEEDYGPSDIRTGHDGHQLLFPLTESDCVFEEVWLLGEYPDRVEVEIRMIAKPPPPGSYGCMGLSVSGGQGPHAAIELAAPLDQRTLVIRRDPI